MQFLVSIRVGRKAALLVYQMQEARHPGFCRCGFDLFDATSTGTVNFPHVGVFLKKNDLPFLYPCLSRHLHFLDFVSLKHFSTADRIPSSAAYLGYTELWHAMESQARLGEPRH